MKSVAQQLDHQIHDKYGNRTSGKINPCTLELIHYRVYLQAFDIFTIGVRDRIPRSSLIFNEANRIFWKNNK